jgi:hypothetical protein
VPGSVGRLTHSDPYFVHQGVYAGFNRRGEQSSDEDVHKFVGPPRSMVALCADDASVAKPTRTKPIDKNDDDVNLNPCPIMSLTSKRAAYLLEA